MSRDVLIVGGGVAGLSAGIFTARADLDTLVVNAGESILNRNAHLENYPGFPAGVDARLLLKMVRDQASEAGCEFAAGRVVDLAPAEDRPGYVATVEPASDDDDRASDGGHREIPARQVVAASWSDASYVEDVDGVASEQRGSKTFLKVDERGRTGAEGLYAAGRIADQYHQTVVAAGHGATVGVTVVHDSPVDFYHDWVTPERYFTGRDREVPPGCEEIDDEQRRERERDARETMLEYFEEPLDERPTMHPSVDEE